MDSSIAVALSGLAGSGLGAFGGVMASARLTQYRPGSVLGAASSSCR